MKMEDLNFAFLDEDELQLLGKINVNGIFRHSRTVGQTERYVPAEIIWVCACFSKPRRN